MGTCRLHCPVLCGPGGLCEKCLLEPYFIEGHGEVCVSLHINDCLINRQSLSIITQHYIYRYKVFAFMLESSKMNICLLILFTQADF